MLGLFTILGVLALFTLAFYLLPYSIIKPLRFDVIEYAEDYPSGLYPSDYDLDFDRESIMVDDGIALSGYRIQSTVDNPIGTMLFLHGIGGVKEKFLEFAQFVTRQGFHCFIYDARGHGESGGQYCTFGAREKHDVVHIINYLEEMYDEKVFAIWGNSMGGAVALQALAIEPRLEFGIVESTFADFRQIVQDYQQRFLKISLPWFINPLLNRAGKIGRFNPDEVRPGEAARHIKQPMLIVHGSHDVRVKLAYGQEIFNNLASSDKDMYIVEGGVHHNLYENGGQAYLNYILDFIARQGKKILQKS